MSRITSVKHIRSSDSVCLRSDKKVLVVRRGYQWHDVRVPKWLAGVLQEAEHGGMARVAYSIEKLIKDAKNGQAKAHG